MIKEELEQRHLPRLLCMEDGTAVVGEEMWRQRRAEIAEILQHHFCGYEPPLKPRVKGEVVVEDERTAFAGKAVYQKINLCSTINSTVPDMRSFTFPCHFVRPKNVEKPPVFVYLSFSQSVVDELIPMEEILDNGFAVASYYYQDIAPDTDDNFTNGIASAYSRNPYDSWGKVRMWAWAASRVVDYLYPLDGIDASRIAVAGHSRLGKAALLAGAFDERFSLTVSNDSGGAGAAVFRGKTGEMVKNFRGGVSGCWFAGNFKNYVRREHEMPFDMHFLLAMAAPRRLYVCSAKEDAHADPKSEFLACAAAGEVYENIYQTKGLAADLDEFPTQPAAFLDGSIGYHLRDGHHFLSRYDWQKFMEYRTRHGC